MKNPGKLLTHQWMLRTVWGNRLHAGSGPLSADLRSAAAANDRGRRRQPALRRNGVRHGISMDRDRAGRSTVAGHRYPWSSVPVWSSTPSCCGLSHETCRALARHRLYGPRPRDARRGGRDPRTLRVRLGLLVLAPRLERVPVGLPSVPQEPVARRVQALVRSVPVGRSRRRQGS